MLSYYNRLIIFLAVLDFTQCFLSDWFGDKRSLEINPVYVNNNVVGMNDKKPSEDRDKSAWNQLKTTTLTPSSAFDDGFLFLKNYSRNEVYLTIALVVVTLLLLIFCIKYYKAKRIVRKLRNAIISNDKKYAQDSESSLDLDKITIPRAEGHQSRPQDYGTSDIKTIQFKSAEAVKILKPQSGDYATM